MKSRFLSQSPPRFCEAAHTAQRARPWSKSWPARDKIVDAGLNCAHSLNNASTSVAYVASYSAWPATRTYRRKWSVRYLHTFGNLNDGFQILGKIAAWNEIHHLTLTKLRRDPTTPRHTSPCTAATSTSTCLDTVTTARFFRAMSKRVVMQARKRKQFMGHLQKTFHSKMEQRG